MLNSDHLNAMETSLRNNTTPSHLLRSPVISNYALTHEASLRNYNGIVASAGIITVINIRQPKLQNNDLPHLQKS